VTGEGGWDGIATNRIESLKSSGAGIAVVFF